MMTCIFYKATWYTKICTNHPDFAWRHLPKWK